MLLAPLGLPPGPFGRVGEPLPSGLFQLTFSTLPMLSRKSAWRPSSTRILSAEGNLEMIFSFDQLANTH